MGTKNLIMKAALLIAGVALTLARSPFSCPVRYQKGKKVTLPEFAAVPAQQITETGIPTMEQFLGDKKGPQMSMYCEDCQPIVQSMHQWCIKPENDRDFHNYCNSKEADQ